MLKCTLENSGKEKVFRKKEYFFTRKRFFPKLFFTKYNVIWDPDGSRKRIDAMVASKISF